MKRALDLVFIADSESTQKYVQFRTRVIDLQNDFNMLVAKQWKMIVSVPMSYMRLFENLAVLAKLYLKGT